MSYGITQCYLPPDRGDSHAYPGMLSVLIYRPRKETRWAYSTATKPKRACVFWCLHSKKFVMNSSNDQYIVDSDLPPQKLCGLCITMATVLLRVVHEFSSLVGTVNHSNAGKMIQRPNCSKTTQSRSLFLRSQSDCAVYVPADTV